MNTGEQSGFTIIEVTLFLAITGALLVLAFSFTSSSIRNARFSDATRSLESFLQEQVTRVQTGSLSLAMPKDKWPTCSPIANSPIYTNTGVSDPGTSQSCLLLGSVLDFSADGSTILIHPVLGYASTTDASVADDSQALASINPQVWVDADLDDFVIPWQALVTTKKSVLMQSPYGTFDFQRIIYLRSIKSGSISMYVSDSSTTVRDIVASDVLSPSDSRNVPAVVCINYADTSSLRGVIQIKGSGVERLTGIGNVTGKIAPLSELFFTGVYSGFPGVQCI